MDSTQEVQILDHLKTKYTPPNFHKNPLIYHFCYSSMCESSFWPSVKSGKVAPQQILCSMHEWWWIVTTVIPFLSTYSWLIVNVTSLDVKRILTLRVLTIGSELAPMYAFVRKKTLCLLNLFPLCLGDHLFQEYDKLLLDEFVHLSSTQLHYCLVI